jgi:ABC-2 type transport system permease protein
MRVAFLIAGRILRQRLRDRSAIVFSIITPLGLAFAFSMLIPNEFSSFNTRFVVVDHDRGHVAAVLVDDVLGALVGAGVAEVDPVASDTAAADEVRAGTASAGIVIPEGFTDAVERGQPTELRILGGDFPISLEIARSAVARFANTVGAIQLMVATTSATGGSPDAETVAAAQAAGEAPGPIAVADEGLASRQANLATFYGAAMAIMFVFFATQYGALALLSDRQVGTLNRLLAAPVSPAAIIAGTSLAGFALGLVAMTVLLVATTLFQGANWGPPALVMLLIVAAVIAAAGISTVVASIARTPQQAGGLNAIVALSLSAIGGVFIPISQAPEGLATIAQVTPHYWFLRGVDILSAGTTGLADVLPSMSILLLIGVVTGVVGLVRARGALVPR